MASEFQDFQGLLRYWNPTYSLFCSDCRRISILVRSWIVTESWRNSSTSVPTWSSSSIYSGTIVEQLRLDCGGIQDCLRIGLIALGFCMTVQSFSSSYIPPPILPLGLHWDCCWIEDWVRIVDYVILLLVLLSLRQFFRSDCTGIAVGLRIGSGLWIM